jgi:hypothetical protein
MLLYKNEGENVEQIAWNSNNNVKQDGKEVKPCAMQL